MKKVNSALAALFASAMMTVVPAQAANNMVEPNQVQKMAATARTPKQHAAVARQFNEQAKQFEQKAAQHEANARKLDSATRGPMAYKWPALVAQPSAKERQLAMEARRAAKESLDASARHLHLSVEALAEAAESRSPNSDVD